MDEWLQKSLKTVWPYVATLLSAWGARKARPAFKALKKIANIETIDKELSVVKSKQMAMIHTAADAVFITNALNEVIYVNPAWCEMTGFRDPKDANGFGYMKAIPASHRRDMEDLRDDLIAHPSGWFGEVTFQNIQTKELIKTYCRTELIKDRDNVVEIIGKLTILKT